MTSGGGVGGAGSVDTLYIDVLARVDSLERSMADAERAAAQGGERAGAAFGREFGERAKASSQQLMGILAGLGATAGAAGIGLVKLAGEAEQAQVAFTTLLGSADKAKAFLADLNTFAANTPFELTGLQESSKKLLAFGFQAQQIVPMMTAIGDAVGSLGGGADVLDGVVTALGQIQAKGKVSAEEMAQIAERGIPAWQFLADQMGITVPEAMKKAEQGAISAGQAIPAILQGMQEKFGGGMAAQSKTLLGMWSTTTDTLKQAGVAAGQAIVEALDVGPRLAGFNEFISSIPAKLKEIDLQAWAKQNGDAIAMVAGALTVALLPALAAGASAVVAFVAPLAPFLAAGAAVALVLKNMGVGLDDVKGAFNSLRPRLEELAGVARNTFDRAIRPAIEALTPAVQTLVSRAGPLLKSLGEAFVEVARASGQVWERVLLPLIQRLAPIVQQAVTAVMDVLGNVIEVVKNVARAVAAIVNGDWAQAWDYLKNAVGHAVLGVQEALKGILTAIGQVIGSIGKFIDQKADEAWTAFTNFGASLATKLKNGLLDGIDNLKFLLATKIVDAINGMIGVIPGWAKGLLGIGPLAAPQAPTPHGQPQPGQGAPTGTGYAALLQSLGVGGFGLSTDYAGHRGKDVRTPEGTALRAPGPVKVQFGFQQGGYGQFLQLTQEDGSKVVLAHLKTINQDILNEIKKTGYATVGAGTLLGTTGGAKGAWYSQNSTGPHLHAEILAAGANLNRYLAGPNPGATTTPTATTPRPSSPAAGGGVTPTVPLPTPAEQAAYSLSLADWNKHQREALAIARQLKEADVSKDDGFIIRVRARADAFKAAGEAQAASLAFASEKLSRVNQQANQQEEETALQRDQRLRREALAREALERQIRSAGADRLNQIIKTGVTETNTLEKINLAEAELARRKQLTTEAAKAAAAAREKAEKDAADKAEAAAKARAAALLSVAQAVQQGNIKAAQRGLDEAKRIQSEEVNAAGLSADQRVKVYEASTGKVLKAAYLLHAEEKRQADAAVDAWAKSEEAKALTTKERDAEVARRKAENRAAEREANLASQRDQAALLKQATDLQIQEGERAADALRKQAQDIMALRYKLSADLIRYSYGQGDDGLVSALASITGYTVEQVSTDVDKALAVAEKLNSGLTNGVKNAYGPELEARKKAREEQVAADARAVEMAGEARAQIVAAFQAEQAAADDALITLDSLDAMYAELAEQGRSPIDSGMIDWLEDVAKGTGESAAAAQAWLDKWAKALELLPRVGKTVEELGADVQAEADAAAEAWDEENITLGSLLDQIAELREQGRDPMTSGFLDYLDGIIEKGGPVAEAAQQVKAMLEQTTVAATNLGAALSKLSDDDARLEDWSQKLTKFADDLEAGVISQEDFNTQAQASITSLNRLADAAERQGKTELASYYRASAAGLLLLTTATSDYVAQASAAEQRLESWNKKLTDLVESYEAGAITQREFRTQAGAALPELLRLAKAADDGTESGKALADSYRAAAQALRDLGAVDTSNLNPAALFDRFNAGRESGDAAGIGSILGVAEGFGKLLSPLNLLGEILNKINPVASIMEGIFSVLAEPLKAIQEPLVTIGTLIGSIIAPVLELFAPILKMVVDIMVAVYDVLAGIVKTVTFGFVNIDRRTPGTSGGAALPAVSPPAPAQTNALVQIPTAQVTVMATPEYAGILAAAARDFREGVGEFREAFKQGVKVNAEVKVASGSSNLAWELGTGGV